MEVEGAMRRDTNYLIVMKHVCRFCHKRFPCGRSLGGHMRSHLITNPSDHETTCKEKVNTSMEKKNQLIPPPTTNAGEFSGEANLKKKLSDQDPNQIKCCKECGRAFHSSKALSGHMKSHAVEREKEKERQRQREKENSLLSDQIEKTPKQQVMDRESDNEAAEAAPKSNRRPRRTIRRQRYMGATSATTTTNSSHNNNNNNGGSSSVSEIDQQEQENVAMCLIMLSRDVGPWGGVNGELSDNNFIFIEPKNGTGEAEEAGENRGLKQFKWVGESSTCKDFKGEGFVADDFLSSGYQKFLGKNKSSEGSGAELGVNLSSKSVLIQSESPNPAMSDVGSSKRKAKASALESEKRSKFECTTCNKTFHSYQALGGHRASHKKAKGCSPSKAEGAHMGDVSVPLHKNKAKDTSEGGVKKGVHMTHKHECPICFKEFPSGQALGGHKRSHLMATATLAAPLEAKFVSVEKSNATTVTTTTTTTTSSHEVRDFLDLNLPAPVEEEASNGHHQQQQQQQQLDLVGFKPWWVESTHKHEQLVSLISN